MSNYRRRLIKEACTPYATSGLVLLYTKNGISGSTWKNEGSGGSALDGAITGTFNTDHITLNGSTDYIKTGAIDWGECTIEISFALKRFIAGYIMDARDSSENGYQPAYFDPNIVETYSSKAGGINQCKILLNTLSKNTLTVIYSSSKIASYINASNKKEIDVDSIVSYTENLYIGVKHALTSFSNIDVYAVRVYNRALSDDEITRNYNTDKL